MVATMTQAAIEQQLQAAAMVLQDEARFARPGNKQARIRPHTIR
jgi:hypothetical protein